MTCAIEAGVFVLASFAIVAAAPEAPWVDSVTVDSIWNSDSTWIDSVGVQRTRESRDCRVRFIPRGSGMVSISVAFSPDGGVTWDQGPDIIQVLHGRAAYPVDYRCIIHVRVFGGDRENVALKVIAREHAPRIVNKDALLQDTLVYTRIFVTRQVTAFDPDSGDSLTYEIDPFRMSGDTLTWMPYDTGYHSARVKVTDGVLADSVSWNMRAIVPTTSYPRLDVDFTYVDRVPDLFLGHPFVARLYMMVDSSLVEEKTHPAITDGRFDITFETAIDTGDSVIMD
ncbi:MAG: hypothetical protein GF331_09565, partial [Chitinivibrionales bacterium]|nr:hypothetical protein [Chitinivibrionales bacterium]